MLVDALAGNKSPNEIAATALRNPWSQDFGQSIAQRSVAQRLEENSPAARLAREKAQFDLDTAREMKPLQTDKLRAEVDAAKRKDGMDQYFVDLIRPGAAPAAASGGMQLQSAPGGQTPGGATVQQIGDTIPPSDPNLIQAQRGPEQGPPTQTAPAQKSPREILAGRSESERLQFMMTYKKDPAKAAEMLQQWSSPGHMAKPTGHDLDKAEIGFTNMLGAFKETQRLHDDKFLQGSPKIQYALNNFRDKWTPETWKNLQLTPKEAGELQAYEKFGATAMNNLNTRLKELSGTAVTATEMERILRELPSPGTGPFSGDGPTAFKAKLEQGMRLAKLGIARTRYLRANNFNGDVNAAATAVPLDEMPRIIQQRGDQIQKMLEHSNPGATPDAIKIHVRRALVAEFGETI